MWQETYTRQHSTSKETDTISVNGDLPGLQRSPVVLLEQRPDIITRAIEPLLVKPHTTQAFTDAVIRAFDVAGSIIMLMLAAPIMLLTAALVRITSSGPVLFNQRRVGKNGKIFILYKFRTMIDGAEKETGPVWAARDDGRVTPVGKVLRCTRLDELPQLFNVLRGDMSLVGPRPERPYFVGQHRALQGIRLTVKPGITGLAQIRAFYDLSPEHKLKYDYLYIQRRSFFLNVYILLMTIPVVLLRRGW
jgi:lipopolysaccharide/colanic/teichoic acid biosynthesis glycosyltransferase